MTTLPTRAEIDQALDHVHTAMIFVDRIFEEEAEAHLRDFVWQMREKLDRPIIPLYDQFLPFEEARSALWLLRALEKIETQTRDMAALLPTGESPGDAGETTPPTSPGRIDEIPPDSSPYRIDEVPQDPSPGRTPPTLPEVTQDKIILNIAGEKHRFRQRLDKERQQAAGVTHYIWQTVGDDRVRPDHASRDGQTFAWGEDLEPGEAFGCRCFAVPSPDEVMPPPERDDSIEQSHLLDALIAIAALLATEIAIARAAQILDKFRRTIRGRSARDKTRERPKDMPSDWTEKPSNKKDGTRYTDPNNPHNEVRVQKGNPNSSNTAQQRDYVRWKKDGQWLDKNGKPSNDPVETHIPLEEFEFNLEIFR